MEWIVRSSDREMVAQLVPTTFFSDQQINVRNQLGQFLQGGFQQPGAIRAVIATFLLSPPGQFRIVNPQKHLPAWLSLLLISARGWPSPEYSSCKYFSA